MEMDRPEDGRVAIVHDFLSQKGGAERVVLALADIFPGAPIFTSFYSPDTTFPRFRDLDVRTGHLSKLVRPAQFRKFAPLFPLMFKRMDLSDFSQVVVSSAAFAHFVDHPQAYVYCHTPPRGLHRMDSYNLSPLLRMGLGTMVAPLKPLDRRAARAKRSYVSNSSATATRVLDTYGLTTPVIHPPLSTDHLPARPQRLPTTPSMLVVSRLLPYKRVDMAIEVSGRTGIPLTIVGQGPDEERLRRLAGPAVTFAGTVSDEDLADLFNACSMVLTPGVEDFGLGPIEAHWAGRPVVGLAAGGLLETVNDGEDGFLLAGHSVDSWVRAVKMTVDKQWDVEEIHAATERFSFNYFKRKILDWMGRET